MDKKYIDAEHFDKRVREAMGIAVDDFPMGYPDPVQTVLAMLKTELSVYVPQWIPVTERLPEKEGLYLITCVDDSGAPFVDASLYDPPTDRRGAIWDFPNVVAWMERPEPYKGGEEK